MKKQFAGFLALLLVFVLSAAGAETAAVDLACEDFTLTLDGSMTCEKTDKRDGEIFLTITADDSTTIAVVWQNSAGGAADLSEDDMSAVADGYLLGFRESVEGSYGSSALADLTVLDRRMDTLDGKSCCYLRFTATLDLGFLGGDYKGILYTRCQEAIIIYGDFGSYCFILSADDPETLDAKLTPVMDTLRWK